MRRFRPSKAFMATTGLTIADGLTNSMLAQAELKRVMIEVSSEVILLTDHTKFGQVASSVVGPVTLLHKVVTDQGISPQMRHALEELGIEVIAVETAAESKLPLTSAEAWAQEQSPCISVRGHGSRA